MRTFKGHWKHSRRSADFPNLYLRQIGSRVKDLWSDIQTNNQFQTNRYYYLIWILGWEPGAAQDTQVTSIVNLKLSDFTRKLNVRYKSRPIHFRILNQSKNIPVALPSSPFKIWGKSVQGFLSCDRTNKRTDTLKDRHTEITTLCVY